jgi:hypothetical protein
MAEQINVSPGLYTSEVDLTFAAQSLGVSSLGIVGEAQRGPAFEPILVKNYDEFTTYFGGANPEKYSGTQILKYEGNYIAREYLSQSSQMYMTRVLGLSGYDAGSAWSISTIAQPDISTISLGSPTNVFAPFQLTTGGTLTFTYPSFLSPYQNVVSSTTNQFFSSVVSSYSSRVNPVLSASTISYRYGDLSSSAIATITAITTTSMSDVLGSNTNDSTWFNDLFISTGTNTFSGLTYGVYVTGLTLNPGGVYSGTTTFINCNASVAGYSGWDNLVVATLRSDANWSNNTLSFVTSNPSMVTVDDIGENAKGSFKITGTTSTGSYSYILSMDDTKREYMPLVLGKKPKEKQSSLFVEEIYPELLNYGYLKGYIRGLKSTLITNSLSSGVNMTNYEEQWATPATPYFVSELRGSNVFKLFRVVTISDGNAANTLTKVSIQNINLDRKEFDLIVRDFNDTDANPVILEKYVRCSMDESQLTYLGKKVGTIDGKYDLKSKFIMIEFDIDAPSNAVPAGFMGYTIRTYGSGTTNPKIQYKTKYFTAGEQITNPPAGISPIISSGDNIRKSFLGISDSNFWGYDSDFFQYKGNVDSTTTTKGFHMDSGATNASVGGVTGMTFDVGVASFQTEVGTTGTAYSSLLSRKFTVAPYGGYDGWDIYRAYRTNGDSYRIGQTTYTNEGFSALGNSDYYAYKAAIDKYSNPEDADINVLVTPGIDIENNSSLVEYTIDMVENDRADSIYIPTLPDINMFASDSSDTNNWKTSQEVVDLINETGIDSNYTAAYYPFVLYNDTENNSKVWMAPTAEVVRNLALTDNISYEWYAIAGTERGLVISKPRRKLSQTDRDTLYPGRINPIATFRGVGPVIWGNRNLQIRDSVLDRLNIRRLLLQTRKLISSVGLRLLFQPNDQQVRNDFLNLVNPILDGIRRERGLTDFRVKLSNAPEDIDNNELNGTIYLKPTSTLEYINIQFVITPQGASFENV